MSIFVQVTDGKITASFSCNQNPIAWPGVIEIEEDDQRYIDFLELMRPSESLIALVERDRLLSEAAIRMAPLQDAVDIGQSTPEELAALAKWKEYRINLGRLDKQPGFPGLIEWPVKPD